MDIAVIENNKVVNVIVCESVELAEQITGFFCVPLDNVNAGIGWSYTKDKTFVEPDNEK